jgi:hypothetical protein
LKNEICFSRILGVPIPAWAGTWNLLTKIKRFFGFVKFSDEIMAASASFGGQLRSLHRQSGPFTSACRVERSSAGMAGFRLIPDADILLPPAVARLLSAAAARCCSRVCIRLARARMPKTGRKAFVAW